MKHRKIHTPTKELLVSPLGLGTVKFGRNTSVKYPGGPFELPDDESAAALLALAKAEGLNLIDTAPAYGISEERLGVLLAGQRDDWILSTKVGEEFDGESSAYDFSADHTKRSLERSLTRLRTDHLDIVHIHSDGNDLEVLQQGVLPTLLQCRDEGMITAVGMSTKTAAGGIAAFEAGCDLIMAMYHPWHLDELPALDHASKHGKSVVIKKAFASGHFGEGEGEDPVRYSLDFIFKHPAVASVIVGTINPDHLKSNCAAASEVVIQNSF